MEGQGIYNDFLPGLRHSINFGYVILPDDGTRQEMVLRSLRTGRFSILVEGGGGIMNNCFATKSAIRDIEFPQEGEKLGSLITFFTDPDGGKVIINGVISREDEISFSGESVTEIKRSLDDNYAFIRVDGKGAINLDVIGTSQNGRLDINVRNDDYTAQVNLHVKGNINIYTEGNISVETVGGDINVNTNKNINLVNNKASIVIDNTGVNIDSGTEDILLYNDNSSISITDSGIELDTDKSIILAGQNPVLYSLVPGATSIMDVSEIGVSDKIKVG